MAKRNRPSAPANSSTSLRSRSFTTSPRLSASKSWSISAWLIGCLKAMQASTSRVAGCQLKICARATLFAHIGGQRLVLDPVVSSETTPLRIRS